jgi:tetratricopeptide (TPR) repeat protein
MKYALLLIASVGCSAQSVQSLTAQIQKTPTAALYVERAKAYLAAGDARQAVADSDRALDRDSLNIRALTLRSQANAKLGRYSDAVTDLSGAIGLSPSDASLYVARSSAYLSAGDQRRSLEDRNEALRLDPGALLAVNRPPEPVVTAPAAPPPAVTATTPAPVPAPVKPPPIAIAIPPAKPTTGTADVHYQRGRTLVNQGKHQEGIAELTDAIQLEPGKAVYFNTRGYGYYLLKDAKRAIQDYDEALRLNPDYLNATHNRAIARKAAGDIAGFEADRKREIELGSKLGLKIQ